MCLSLLETALLLLPPLLLAMHGADNSSETTERSSNVHRENTRGQENLGKVFKRSQASSTHWLHPKRQKVSSLMSSHHFFTMHGTGTCTCNHLWESHTSVNPHWTRFNPHQNMGWLQPGFDSDSSKEGSVRTHATRVEPEFNPGSSCSADVP